MEQMLGWYNSLIFREKLLVLCALILTVTMSFYFFLWAPLNQALEENQKALVNEQALVSWLEEKTLRAKLLQDKGASETPSGTLTQIVNQTTRGTAIAISRMQPQGEELQVLIDSVPFNDLIEWLNTLERRGVVISQSDIIGTNTSGIVQVRRLQLSKRS